MIRHFRDRADLADEFQCTAERGELPGAHEHIAVAFPTFGVRQAFEDLGSVELCHASSPFRRKRAGLSLTGWRLPPPHLATKMSVVLFPRFVVGTRVGV